MSQKSVGYCALPKTTFGASVHVHVLVKKFYAKVGVKYLYFWYIILYLYFRLISSKEGYDEKIKKGLMQRAVCVLKLFPMLFYDEKQFILDFV